MSNEEFLAEVIQQSDQYDYLVTDQLDFGPEAKGSCKRLSVLGLYLKTCEIAKNYLETKKLPKILYAIYDASFGTRVNNVYLGYVDRIIAAIRKPNQLILDEDIAIESMVQENFHVHIHTLSASDIESSLLHHFKEKSNVEVDDLALRQGEWLTPEYYLNWAKNSEIHVPYWELTGLTDAPSDVSLCFKNDNRFDVPIVTLNIIDKKIFCNVWLGEMRESNYIRLIRSFEEQFGLQPPDSPMPVDALQFIVEYLKHVCVKAAVQTICDGADVIYHPETFYRTIDEEAFKNVTHMSIDEIETFFGKIAPLLEPSAYSISRRATKLSIDEPFITRLINNWMVMYRGEERATYGGLTKDILEEFRSIFEVFEFLDGNVDPTNIHELYKNLGELISVGAATTTWLNVNDIKGYKTERIFIQSVTLTNRALLYITKTLSDFLPLLGECQNQDLYDQKDVFASDQLSKYSSAHPEELRPDVCTELCAFSHALRECHIEPNTLAKCLELKNFNREYPIIKKFRSWYFDY